MNEVSVLEIIHLGDCAAMMDLMCHSLKVF